MIYEIGFYQRLRQFVVSPWRGGEEVVMVFRQCAVFSQSIQSVLGYKGAAAKVVRGTGRIGENVWIDNLVQVTIGTNVCISQGAMLLCGNHNYKLPTFDLIVKPIIIENGAWVGAKSTVCPGVTLHTHAVLGVGSVANHDLDAYSIYQGNPAIKIRKRVMEA